MIELSGTQQHQEVLQAILSCYEQDLQIRSIIVFGSLSKGNWDEFSDIDLDIIVKDNYPIDAATELENLKPFFSKANQQIAIAVYHSQDEVDIVFKSLLQLSVRYHVLASIHPSVVESMHILKSSISEQEIRFAGKKNQEIRSKSLTEILDECLRHVLGVTVAVKRNNLWLAEDLLYRIRNNILRLFTEARGGQRSYYFFERNASQELQSRVRKTFSFGTSQSITTALLQIIYLLEEDFAELVNQQNLPNISQKQLLGDVKESLVLANP